MTDFPDGIVIEARKAGLKQAKRKAADGSWFDVHDITFEIHPNDTNSPLSNMPLGTRVALVVTQLREGGPTEAADEQEDEQAPTLPPEPAKPAERPHRKWQELSAREQSVLRCKQPDFQSWICGNGPANEDAASDHVRDYCGVQSRSDLAGDSATAINAQMRWHDLERRYRDSMAGITDEALAEQARMR